MIINFNLKLLEHLKDISKYYHNYYKLPYTIDGCDVLFHICADDDFEEYFILGNLVNNEFEEKLRFYCNTMDGKRNVDFLKDRLEVGEWLT